MSISNVNRFVIFSAQKNDLATDPPSFASVHMDNALIGTIVVMSNACAREGMPRLTNLMGPDCWGGALEYEEGIGAPKMVVTREEMWFTATTFSGTTVKTDPVSIKELLAMVANINKVEIKQLIAEKQWSKAERRFHQGLLKLQKQLS